MFRLRAEAGDVPTSALEREPIRVVVRVDGELRRVSFERALVARAEPPPGIYRDVTSAEIEAALAAARRARLTGLRDLDRVPDRPPVAPEDGSADVAAMHMSFGAADTSIERFIEQMASVGRVEGFRVVVRTHPELVDGLRHELDRRARGDVTLVASDHFGDIWTEDSGEMRTDRTVLVAHQPPEDFDVATTIATARLARFYPGVTLDALKAKPEDYPLVHFGQLGASYFADRDTQRGMAAVAVAAGVPLQLAFSAIEGGNALVGRREDGRPHVVVGRDSVALSRALISRDLGREVDEELVRKAIAKDYGTQPADVVFVEQPADYHLDVRMMLVGPGEVVVNDAREVAKKVAEWSRTDHARRKPRAPTAASKSTRESYAQRLADWREERTWVDDDARRLAERAERESVVEARTVADLEAAGLKVHRMAGKFPHSRVGLMNFLNVEQGRGRDGGRFVVALGGDKRAETYARQCFERFGAGRIDRMYFLDRDLTPGTLEAMGGISCRSKIEVARP
ncbi:hypothetical protein L6R52_40310 [Myxococcota bacterium]|nr:hypothetical protein [Myxococcota bacterium]